VNVSLFCDSVHVLLAHRDNELFPKWTFSSYVNFWSNLLIVIEGNIIHFNNFLRCELWEGFIDFLNIAFSGLGKQFGL